MTLHLPDPIDIEELSKGVAGLVFKPLPTTPKQTNIESTQTNK